MYQRQNCITASVSDVTCVESQWHFGVERTRRCVERVEGAHLGGELAPPQPPGFWGRHQMRSKQFAVTRGVLGIVAFALVIAIENTTATTTSAFAANAVSEGRVLDEYAKLPVAFIENAGQVDARVRYYARGNRFGFYL